jgi:hypothetical protein
LLTSTYALEEAGRNLELKSAEFESRLAKAIEHTTVVGEAPAALVIWAQEQGLPLKDAPVLAAAVHAKADLFVTGDTRHFGHLFGRTVRGTHVVTLTSALDIVSEKRWCLADCSRTTEWHRPQKYFWTSENRVTYRAIFSVSCALRG